MNYIIANGICCCLNLCCKQSWETLYKILGKTSFIKIAYCLVYFSVIGISIVGINLLTSLPLALYYVAPGINCHNQIQQGQGISCLTGSVIYRVSSCLFLFSIIMLLLLKCCSSRIGLILNEGLFFSKFVIIMAFFLISLQMDNSYFNSFGLFGQIFSYIFALCQAIIIVDLAYLWGIKWARRYSDGDSNFAIWLIGFTILFIVLSILFIVLGFSISTQFSQPNYICLVQIVLMIGIQLMNWNIQNSLLTTSIICCLVSYYTWGANYSHPQTTQVSSDVYYLQIAINFIIMMICTGGSIYGSTNKQDNENILIDLDQQQNLDGRQIRQINQHRQNQISVWTYWLLYLCGLSLYSSMIVTDWGSTDIITQQYNLTTNAWLSKIFMGSFLTIIYIWSLLAPRLCPNRNFYFE